MRQVGQRGVGTVERATGQRHPRTRRSALQTPRWSGPAEAFLVNTPVFLLPGQLNLQSKHRVLDVHAGGAAIVRFLATRIAFDAPPVALDPSSVAVGHARGDFDLHPSVDIVAGQPDRLPFAGGSFDLVIAAHLFHRLDDAELQRCMAEAHRVLRPGGVFAGWDFAPLSSRTLNRLHLRLLAGAKPARLRGFGPLADVVSSAGFARIERPVLRPFLFPPIPRTAILAQKGEGSGRTPPLRLPVLHPTP